MEFPAVLRVFLSLAVPRRACAETRHAKKGSGHIIIGRRLSPGGSFRQYSNAIRPSSEAALQAPVFPTQPRILVV